MSRMHLFILFVILSAIVPSQGFHEDLYTAIIDIDYLGTKYSEESNYTGFFFNIRGEILNTAEEYTQLFPTTCTHFFFVNVSLDDSDNFSFGGDTCGQAFTDLTYLKETRMIYHTNFDFYLTGKLFNIPSGEINIQFWTNQTLENTFWAKIISNGTEISIYYDELPAYWYDYPGTVIYNATLDPNDFVTNLFLSSDNILELKVNNWSLLGLFVIVPVIKFYRKQNIN
ncbi:MAG: hypothetical protein INQ03_25200 [Candidatus Heimdallarchaeota archaeon]|nr:hypothetical protein [Candidatus Heimdallarchaeota archaeon]